MQLHIRPADASDLPAINAIYNHFVPISTCTYQLDPSTQTEREQWFRAHPVERYPIVVACAAAQVVGWGALRPFHVRAGFRFTVENSVYVHPDHLHRGIGRAILADLLGRAQDLGFRSIIAVISADQLPSVALHASVGFQEVGRLPKVGFKFGRWLDMLYLQKFLTPPSAAEPPPKIPGTR